MWKLTESILLVWIVFWFIQSCTPKQPVQVDTDVKYTVVVVDTTGLYNPADSSRHSLVAGATLNANSTEYVKNYTFRTDDSGKVVIEGVIASNYRLDAHYPVSRGTALLGSRTVSIISVTDVVDTIYLSPIQLAPVLINEIYYAGPQNNIHFFYDQYIELFNRSDSTVYLDGMILTRCRTSPEFRVLMDTVDYVQNVYAYKFPGTPGGNDYPLEPGEYIVIATDAYDHSQTVTNAVDLSHADFEFFNQYRNDYDNPDVPNLLNIIPNIGVDFYIGLGCDAVVLADGSSYEVVMVSTSYGDRLYCNVPISTVLDGVEYGSASTAKGLTYRIDTGKAGGGLQKYSGKTIQRANPFQDTNNSTNDFQITNGPTPGYQ